MTRLQPLNLEDFTGGLNLRATQFNLADNESPGMLNVNLDPRGGFRTREGWERWNVDEIVADPADWDPRNAFATRLSTGAIQVYVANNGTVHAAGGNGSFSDLGVTVGSDVHLADFEAWGDVTYIAAGDGNLTIRRDGTNAPTTVDDASLGYNPDPTTPLRNRFPVCKYVAAHSGYMFAAGISEGGVVEYNRLRWSFPDEPQDWGELDYLDIDTGGGRITGLMSFQDHLLIFKTDSVWALYGYDLESWQLIQVSRAVGLPACTAVTRSEDAVYMYSASGRNGVYRYDGRRVELISEQLDPAMEQVVRPSDIWVGWVGRRLWATIPWDSEQLGNSPGGTTFVWDPTLNQGNGAWTAYQAALGTFRQAIEGSDTLTDWPLGTLNGDSGHAVLLRLDLLERAADNIVDQTTGSPFHAEYTTRWMTAGWPDRRKSWRRPRGVVQLAKEDVLIRMDAYKDYNETDPSRTFTAGATAQGTVFFRELGFDSPLGGGFDFKALGAADPSGRGADWGASPEGSELRRNTAGLGVNRALQLRLSTLPDVTPGAPWGFSALLLKYVLRRFTT